MAEAVIRLFPDAKIGIGPSIENGFYYDFDLPRPLTPEDLLEIEEHMKEIIRICKENKIAVVAQFAIPNDEDDGVLCTTTLTTKEYDPPAHMIEATAFLSNGGRPPTMNMTVESANGDQTHIAVLG